MARKVQTSLVDDIEGTDITDGGPAADAALDNVGSARAEKGERVAAAQRRVASAQTDTAAIEQAEAALAAHEERVPRPLHELCG